MTGRCGGWRRSTPEPRWWASVAAGELEAAASGRAGVLLPRDLTVPLHPSPDGHRPPPPLIIRTPAPRRPCRGPLRSEQTGRTGGKSIALFVAQRPGVRGRWSHGPGPPEELACRRSDFPREGPVLDLLGPALHLGRRGREAGRGSAPPAPLAGSPHPPRLRPLTQLLGHSEWNTW